LPKLTERILTASKSLLTAWMPGFKEATIKEQAKVLREKSPEVRKEYEDSFKGLITGVDATMKGKLEELLPKRSHVSPEDGKRIVDTIFWTASLSYIGAHVAGLIAEAVSLGQLEKISDVIEHYMGHYGVPLVLAASFYDPYSIAVRTPYRYWLNKQYTPIIPTAADLTRMVVREAFLTKEQYWEFIKGAKIPRAVFDETWEATAVAPADFSKWMEYQGWKKDWSNKFWFSHWELPTFTQAQEMLFRKVIDLDTFKFLLRLNDVMPVWIDKLSEIAFRIPRLRDVRLGWEFLGWDDERMRDVFRLFGYRPEDIEWVIPAFKGMVLRSAYGRVRTAAVTMFVRGLWDEKKLREELALLGRREEMIKYDIWEAKLKREEDIKMMEIKAWLIAFRKDKITEQDLIRELTNLGVEKEMVNAYVKLEKARKKAELSELVT